MHLRIITALTLALILISCVPAQDEAIRIGGLFALTGRGSQFGEDELRGATLATEDINAARGVNGKRLVLVTEDTQTDFTATITAYRKLVDVNGITHIVGPTWGPFSEVIIPLLEEDGTIAISPSTGEEIDAYKSPQFFKTWGADRLEIPVLIEHMERQGITKVSAIVSTGAFEESMLQGFLMEAGNASIEIVGIHKTSPGEKDFRSMLERVRSEDVEAIYLVLAGFDNTGLLFKQLYEIGLDMPVYAWSGFENHGMLEKYGQYLENARYPVPVITDQDKRFNQKFEDRFASPPLTPAAATSYDAVMLLAQALGSVDDPNDTQAVKDALHEISGYSGASPITRFDENGWAVTGREYKVRTVRDSKFVDMQG